MRSLPCRRRPSWTDRILYKINAIDIYDDIELNAQQHTYESHSNYSVSDHKPVIGDFDIVVKYNHNSKVSSLSFFF